MTLSFKKLGKGVGGGDYYLKAAAVGDYYHGTGAVDDPALMREPAGRWFDPTRALPGEMHGQRVGADEFRAYLGGFNPATDAAMVRGAGERHVSGYDFTFSTPKGVSVLWSQLPDPMRTEIEAVQAAAVERALQFMTEKGGIARRGAGGTVKERVGLVAALWPHASSRENDPQIHTHCTVLNLARCQDGIYRTIDVSQILRWQSAVAGIYHAELATLLADRLGIRCAVKDGDFVFDCLDVPLRVREHWSKRSAQIKLAVAERGLDDVSKAVLDRLTVETRDKKSELARAELIDRWRVEGEQIGFTESDAVKCLGVATQIPLTMAEVAKIAEEAIERLTQTQSVFNESQAHAMVGVALQGRGGAEDIERAIRHLIEAGKIQHLGATNDGALAVYSTQAMIDLEREMVARAAQSVPSNVLASDTVEHAILGKPGLSDEQADAVRHACLDPHRAVIVEGAAGAGKSYAMEAVKAAYEAAGYELTGLALSWSAASVLAESAKIQNTRAVEGFVRDLAKGVVALTYKSVVVIDEAGLVGSRHMAAILKAVEAADAKLILTGESKQLSPADAGGAMGALAEVLGAAHMDEVRRQGAHVRHEPDQYATFQWQRDAVLQFREGHAGEALDRYREVGNVRFCDDQEGALNAMLVDWAELRSRHPEKTTLLLANDNATVREINQRVRDRLQAAGIVAGQGVTLKTSDLRKSADAEFGIGDRVMFRMNDRELGIQGDAAKAACGVFNRTVGTLRAIRSAADGVPMLTIELDHGGMVEIRAGEGGYFDRKSGGVPIQHAYATTIYASQGMTVDQTFLLDSRRIDRRLAYVGASRHREGCKFYFSRAQIHERMMERAGADEYRPLVAVGDEALLNGVKAAWSRSSEKLTTIQFLKERERDRTVLEASAPAQTKANARPDPKVQRERARRRIVEFDRLKRIARALDFPVWLIRQGVELVKDGISEWKLRREGHSPWLIFPTDGASTWLAHDGEQTLDPIGFVQQHWGVRFREAVQWMAGGAPGDLPPMLSPLAQARANPDEPLQMRWGNAQQQAAGLKCLEVEHGITRATILRAMREKFMSTDEFGIVFVGRDEKHQIRNAETRLLKPVRFHGQWLTERSHAGADTSFPPIFFGTPAEVHLVEGGVDALALVDRHQRRSPGKALPTILVTGRDRTLKWENNPEVARLLRDAAGVVIHKGQVHGSGTVPGHKEQASTGPAHSQHHDAVVAIRGSSLGLRYEDRSTVSEDLADRSKAQAQAVAKTESLATGVADELAADDVQSCGPG